MTRTEITRAEMAGATAGHKMTRLAVVLGAAFLMSWPAFWNGYPLLYWGDSIAYLEYGRHIARGLFLGEMSGSYGDRSLLYSLGIFPFHLNENPWPVVGLNAFLTAYVLWLLVRSLRPERAIGAYLTVIVPLGLLTGLGWYVCFIMPDILLPSLCLSFYLLAFFRDELSGFERFVLVSVSWWAVMSHASHLALAAGLIVLIAGVSVLQQGARGKWMRGVNGPGAILLGAILTQLLLHNYLLGEPRLFNNPFPFVLIRVVTDPPGLKYLEHRCQQADLVICEYVHELPEETWEFLWAEEGIWQRSSPEIKERLRQEEMRVVLGTISMYPWEQFRISLGYFWGQLTTFGLSHIAMTDQWVVEHVEQVLPGGRSRYLASRQLQRTLHERFFAWVQSWTVLISLFVAAASAMFYREKWSPEIIALAWVIAYTLLTNAAITGMLSEVADRYQGRVIWLIPLFAGLLLWSRRRPASGGIADTSPGSEGRNRHAAGLWG